MPYVPKTSGEILRDLKGSVLGRSSLDDISSGSVVSILLGAVANELASSERRLYNLRESFFLNGASGSDLDERVSELPAVGVTRIESTNASGAVLKLSRDPALTTTNLTIPASSRFRSADGTAFETTSDVIIVAGDAEVENVHIRAVSPGVEGNKAVNEIYIIENAPSEIISAQNTLALTNGLDEEPDEDLRERAYLYLKSLNRCQASSIEYMASSFIGSSNDRFRYAKMYEDVNTPGYSELYVDDGSDLSAESMKRAGASSGITVPAGGAIIVPHEAPATAPIDPGSITITRGAGQINVTTADYTSIHERGLLYFVEGFLQPGDTVWVQLYDVFTGLIAEVQREIEGDPNTPDRLTGFRAAGTRVVVKPIIAAPVELDMSLISSTASDFDLVTRDVKIAIAAFINNLAPGEPLYISQLVDACVAISGVVDIKFYEPGSDTRKDNVFPALKNTLRITEQSIRVTPNN